MRRGFVLGLVLLVLVFSLPLMVSMTEMADCPACVWTNGAMVWASCLAVLSLLLMFVPGTGKSLRRPSRLPRELLLAGRLDRPPQVV